MPYCCTIPPLNRMTHIRCVPCLHPSTNQLTNKLTSHPCCVLPIPAAFCGGCACGTPHDANWPLEFRILSILIYTCSLVTIRPGNTKMLCWKKVPSVPGLTIKHGYSRLPIPAGILRIPVFSAPVAFFQRNHISCSAVTFLEPPSGNLSVWGLCRKLRRI
jgi:hypothetical protein